MHASSDDVNNGEGQGEIDEGVDEDEEMDVGGGRFGIDNVRV